MGDEKPYIDPLGEVYESYEAYCNSPDLDLDLIQVKLGKGERTPQNDFERRLLKEIEDARRNGKCLEIYPN